jgi:hypothetical protein
MNAKFDLRIPLPPILVMILCVVASVKLLPMKPMLDEQFLLAWAHAKPAGFLSCAGLLPGELWGPLTPISILISQLFSFGVPWIWRLHNLLIYSIASVIFFYAAKRHMPVIPATLLAALVAVGIAIFPVGWLGARGVLLAFFFVSIALLFYVRRTTRVLLWTSLAALCFVFAICSSFSSWPAAAVFAIVEAAIWFGTPKPNRQNGTFSLVAPMVPMVIAACALAAIGFQQEPPVARLLKIERSQAKFAATMRSTFKKDNFVVIADVPERLAPSPYFISNGAILYDGHKSVMAANRVCGGLLKDALKAGRAPVPCYRWDAKHQMFPPIYLTFEGENAAIEFDAAKLGNLFEPPVAFFKTASFDEKQNLISIKSELPTTGPVMRVSGRWMNPTVADFIWVEAKIDSPRKDISSVELYWTTALQPDYERKFRHELASAIVNDGKFHRYFFPVRSTAWYCSGQPQQLTFGFPAQSTVEIKAMGTMTKEKLCPDVKLDIKSDARGVAVPCFGFPNIPELGSYVSPFDANSLPATFRVQPEATGILFEISLPNKDFENPNGNKLSGVTFKTLPIDSTGPTAELPIEDLPQPGVYAVRGIAMDKGHNPIGNFSDTLYVLIQKPNPLGWRTR